MTASDSTFSAGHRALAGDAIEIGDAVLVDLIPAVRKRPLAENTRLDLLPPGDLPIEHTLSAAERPVMRDMLVNLLHALHLPDRTAGLRRLEDLLGGLRHGDRWPAPIGETGIPANGAQVDDFDSYFRVNRIASAQPALGLVRGLLQTAHAVMAMFCRADHLPQEQVEQQIAGFIVYTHLLARTFDLGELS